MLGEVAPERVAGVHLNLGSVAAGKFDDLTPAELADLEAEKEMQRSGRGYSEIQGPRPQTLGYGLTDSPAGQGRLDLRGVLGHVVGAPVLGELRQFSGQGDRAIWAVGLPA
ncbi:hypothetical protein [Streptomyces sp. SID10815]|uniref:hypothetical protein n=1 Tax=Streptomyces sp. SID10815 TaxID=2706027 RepID=UPI001EF1ED4D|nr:hypothetical protein [Streptomyces sp. SID10815]